MVPRMGILAAWLGEYHLSEISVGSLTGTIPSRVINVSDLKQFERELATVCVRVDISRPEHGQRIPLAESIEDASDDALGAVVVAGYRLKSDGAPVIMLQAGKRNTAQIHCTCTRCAIRWGRARTGTRSS